MGGHLAESHQGTDEAPAVIANRRLLKLPIIGKQPLAYLFDVGFTRDVWMHRVDIAHAIGYGLDLDADHDGRLMEDYVAEWASVYDIRSPSTSRVPLVAASGTAMAARSSPSTRSSSCAPSPSASTALGF